MQRLFTSNGSPIDVGTELGSGGEGSVHDLSQHPRQVAKLYHRPLDAGKQAKLRHMASVADEKLLQYVAWPQDTLHARPGGGVIGFLMPKVERKAPVHHLYNPGTRQKEYPNAAWDFLVFTARNIAASFETIHSRGHVIGDVNENSVMSGADSTVTLIDSDSFQVDARGQVHLCKVGVPNFTPPEIQAQASFDQFRRTPNHDNFGLALLIFHLLMGGRHPFSGVPLRAEAEPSLPTDIRYFRYAYANDHQSRGVKPPPGSVPVDILPQEMVAMFQRAFTETGTSAGRPTANEWVSALDVLRSSLTRCKASNNHLYPRHLGNCPWCALGDRGILLFVDLGSAVVNAPGAFVMAKTWALIEAIHPPRGFTVPYPGSFKVKGMPLQDSLSRKSTILFWRLTIFLVTFTIILARPESFIPVLVCGAIGWIIASSIGRTERLAEKRRRGRETAIARATYEALLVKAKQEIGPQAFHNRKAEFVNLRAEWEGVPQAEAREINRLIDAIRQAQKQRFLGAFLIEDASLPGLGSHRKAKLQTAGIRSAAEISINRLAAVAGIGPGLSAVLLQWRNSYEQNFSFNPLTAISPQQRNAVKAEFARKRQELERALNRGPEELTRWRQQANSRTEVLKARLDQAARELAEADADLAALKF